MKLLQVFTVSVFVEQNFPVVGNPVDFKLVRLLVEKENS
jgi:hypothetical protein